MLKMGSLTAFLPVETKIKFMEKEIAESFEELNFNINLFLVAIAPLCDQEELLYNLPKYVTDLVENNVQAIINKYFPKDKPLK